jgi:hypothetical protein
MLAISMSDNSNLSAKLVNAFWLVGISLDVSGAVLASLTVNIPNMHLGDVQLTDSFSFIGKMV